MKSHPGILIIFRCELRLAEHLCVNVPVWCSKMKVNVELKSCLRVKQSAEITLEARWDTSELAIAAVKDRLTSTNDIKNVRIIEPTPVK